MKFLLDVSVRIIKNWPFIREYVGESVSTCLESHMHVSISTGWTSTMARTYTVHHTILEFWSL